MIDQESAKVFLQNLDELILDEEKIVTARSLSRTLNIKYQDACDIISTWIKNKSNVKNLELQVTYAITGTKNDGSLLVTILRENAVVDFIKDLSDVSKTVYSVQKGTILKDIQILATVEPSFQPCLGAIRNTNNKNREVPVVHQTADSLIKACPKVENNKKTAEPAQTSKSSKKIEEEILPQTQKNTKNKNNVKGGIANFLNKGNSKEPPKTSKKAVSVKPNSTKSMQHFFKKVSPPKDNNIVEEVTKPVVDVKKLIEDAKEPIEPDVEVKLEEQSPTKHETPMSEDEIIENTPEVKVMPKKRAASKKNANNKKSKRARDNSDEDGNNKKRKRIVALSDSSDDDIFGEDKSDDDMKKVDPEIEPIADDKTETRSEEKSLKKNPFNKRVKKVVNRTYTDDEGFIITQREVEECSGSEEEEVAKPEPPSSPPKQKAKKPVTNANTKQSNLMNFFKKK